MGNSRWFFTLSGTILLVGAIAIGGRGINFGIDFVSGTQITVSLKHKATVPKVVSAIESLHLTTGTGSAKQSIGPPIVQQVSNTNASKRVANTFQISTKTLDANQVGSALDPSASPGTVAYVLDKDFGLRQGEPQLHVGRGELRQDGREQCGDRDHRVAAGDQRVYRVALPVEVRGAGADRVDA